MALKAKDPEAGATAPEPRAKNVSVAETPPPRVNAEVEKRLNPYIEATANEHQRYLKLASENPERAARLLSLKDMEYLEREHTLNKKQIEGAKQWLEKQPTEVQELIARQQTEIGHPQMRDMEFVRLVLNRMRFENRQALGATSGPKTGAARMAV